LAVFIALFGLSGFHAEDDPNDTYAYDRTESILHLSLDAPGGTSLDSGGSAPVGVTVRRYSWEIWRQPSTGLEEYRNASSAPESGASVSLSLSTAVMGYLGNTSLTTNPDGLATTTFSPDGGTGGVYVNAAVESSTASLYFDVAYSTLPTHSVETWSYSRTEATLVAELSTTGSTDNVYPGETRDLSLSVRYETWDVMTSSMGNSRTENHTSAPAQGASVNWVSDSGDASVSGYGTVEMSGVCQGSLTMGHAGSVIRADVAYAAGQATSADLSFGAAPPYAPPVEPTYTPPYEPTYIDPGSVWTYSRSETTRSIANLAAGGPTELSLNEIRTLTGEVRQDVWDIWVNGYGAEERRFNYSGPAPWVVISSTLESGDATLGSSSSSSDGSGWFSMNYTMGSCPARITFYADDPGTNPNGSASVDLTPSPATGSSGGGDGNGDNGGGTSTPTVTHLYNTGAYRFEGPHSDGPTYDLAPGTQRTISGVVYWDSWAVWGDQYGNTTIQSQSTSPVTSTTLFVSMAQGDGVPSDTQITTDWNGGFSTTFTMGQQPGRVRVQIGEGTPAGISAEIDFTPPPAGQGDTFQKIRDESSLFVSLADSTVDGALRTDSSIPLRARVTATTWEVWENANGVIELRNHATGPAIGAWIQFAVNSGSGVLSQNDYLTDADGAARADFLPTRASTVVSATASFLTTTATGEITVSPATWTYQSTESRLLLSLAPAGSPTNGVAATVRLQTWETWVNPATGLGEIMHQSEGPAANATVTFQSLSAEPSASFSPATVMTGTDGTVAATYTSAGEIQAQATVSFAGITITETILLPASNNSNGGFGGGYDYGNGSGGTDGGGSGTGGNGTTTNSTTEEGNGNQNLGPLPATRLRGRSHHTNEPTNLQFEGGVTLSVMVRMFRAKFIRQRYDEDNQPLEPEEDEETGLEQAWQATMDTYLNDPSGPWEIQGFPEFYDELSSLIGGGNSFTAYNNFGVWGKAAPEIEETELSPLATAAELEELSLGQNEEHLGAGLVAAGFSLSFSANQWGHDQRSLSGSVNPHAPAFASSEYTYGIVPQVNWSELWLDAEFQVPEGRGPVSQSFLFHVVQRDETFTKTGEWFATVKFEIQAEKSVSTTTPTVTWNAPNAPTTWVQARTNGTVLLRPAVERGKMNGVSLLPVEVVELAPKVKDEEGNEIEGSEKPNQGEPLTPFVEEDPHANRIAHRELKVRIGESFKGKKITWTLEPLFVPNYAETGPNLPAVFRGEWSDSETHSDRFEPSTVYGANGFTKTSQEEAETTVSDDGFTAIRVNVPPIGFNQVRIKIQIEGVNTPIDLIDMEVPGVVVIDPGHGAHDPGAVGRTDNTVKEKDLALAYGLKLREELIDKFSEESRGLRIVMTRKTTDGFLTPQKRTERAKEEGADVIVSIHFNSSNPDDAGNYARGTETFVQGTGNHNINEDAALAGALQQTTVSAIQSQDANGRHRTTYSNNWVLNDAGESIPGVKTAGLAVTKDGITYNGNTQEFKPVKACLLEVEFLSNESALNTVKIPGASGEAIRDSFAQGAATNVYGDILNQP